MAIVTLAAILAYSIVLRSTHDTRSSAIRLVFSSAMLVIVNWLFTTTRT